MLRIISLIVALQFSSSYGFRIQPRIVNGEISQPFQFRSYIYLQSIPNAGEKASSCGGTLISNRWVLTAAHCLEKQRDVFVLGGIDKYGKFYGRERVNVSNQHIHPKYDAITLANDIALISLRGPIHPNAFIAPAQLPNDCGNILDNQAAIAAGRGIISTNGTLDRRLRYATLQTAPRHICHKVTNQNIQPTSLICAISKSGQYVYNGDSGGPLIRKSDSTLIGVASFVKKTINTEIEGNFVVNQFFQNIHFHFNWISSITGLKLPACSRPLPVVSSWEGLRIKKINPDTFRQ